MKQEQGSMIPKSIGAGIIVLLLSVTQSYAHYPWINAADYSLDTGKAVAFTIGWGHRYPFDGFLKNEELASVHIIGPGTNKNAVISTSVLEYQSEGSIGEQGTYVIAAERKPGFYTKTTEGGKRSSKKGLAKDIVIKSSHSTMCVKAIVNIGVSKSKADVVVGHALEIVPQVNPADLRAGDYMTVEVLLKGKPFKGIIYATYVGFSTEENTFAYTTSTDSKGVGKIKILNSGVWMIKADHKEPYHDPTESDMESYVATLTFEVK